jgi:Tetratricopeptide repeat
MSERGRTPIFLPLLVLLALSPLAHAEDPPADEASPPTSTAEADRRAAEAKQRYENGMAHFNLEEWDPAIEEWKAGYRAKPSPQFLYNIAQAYRASKRYDKALSFYQRYLRSNPKASNRAEVERHISSLTSLIEQETKAQGQPPTTTLPVKTPPPHETPVVVAPSPAPVAVVVEPVHVEPSPAPVVLIATPPEPVPVTKRKWFLPVVISGAVVVVAVVVAVSVVEATSGGSGLRTLPLATF